jgi:hypothetical protein
MGWPHFLRRGRPATLDQVYALCAGKSLGIAGSVPEGVAAIGRSGSAADALATNPVTNLVRTGNRGLVPDGDRARILFVAGRHGERFWSLSSGRRSLWF